VQFDGRVLPVERANERRETLLAAKAKDDIEQDNDRMSRRVVCGYHMVRVCVCLRVRCVCACVYVVNASRLGFGV
jgi:hypothetical protein